MSLLSLSLSLRDTLPDCIGIGSNVTLTSGRSSCLPFPCGVLFDLAELRVANDWTLVITGTGGGCCFLVAILLFFGVCCGGGATGGGNAFFTLLGNPVGTGLFLTSSLSIVNGVLLN